MFFPFCGSDSGLGFQSAKKLFDELNGILDGMVCLTTSLRVRVSLLQAENLMLERGENKEVIHVFERVDGLKLFLNVSYFY